MAAPSVVNVTTPQTGAAQTMAVNMPASIVAGNLLLVTLAHGGTMSTPAGWTVKEDSNAVAIYYRWADGTEPSTVTFSTSTLSTITQAVAHQISGAIGSGDPFDGVTTTANTAQVTTAAISLTTTVVDTLLLFIDAKNASRTASVAPSGFSIDTPNPGVTHAYRKTQAAAGSTGSLTSMYTSGSNHSTLLAAIKPAANVNGSASAAATVATTAAGVRGVGATGTLAPAVALSADARVGKIAAADRSASVGLTAAGTRGASSASTLVAAVALVAAGVVGVGSAGTTPTTVDLTAAGSVERNGGGTAPLTVDLTAAGVVSKAGAGAQSLTVALVADGEVQAHPTSTATLGVGAGLTADATVGASAPSTQSVVVALAATGQVDRLSDGELALAVSLTAVGEVDTDYAAPRDPTTRITSPTSTATIHDSKPKAVIE